MRATRPATLDPRPCSGAWLLPALAMVAMVPGPAAAQRWDDSTTMALVRRAEELRARQLADTGLADYQARAHGYLTFLAQLGEEEVTPGASAPARFSEPPRVVKADELELEIFWKAPNRSKQRIVGRRDTLLLPTDIDYHRDHLGIVQHNFPGIIRLGEGDEVRDVPHPLSAAGLLVYEFAITDSLAIGLADRRIQVYEVKVRPRDDRAAAVIGALYLERESGQVVRMTFGFTRAAFRDRQLEDLTIVLDNALVEGRFWLPRSQEIEIRRSGTWMKFPARGIIRGRWRICCYEVNVGISESLFRGEEIVLAPPAARAAHRFSGRILDSLPPDVRAVSAAEVRRVQEEARELVRAEALARGRATALAAGSASDVVRVNRIEGLAFGVGLDREMGHALRVTVRGRYGTADRRLKAEGSFGVQRASGAGLRLIGVHGLRDASDWPETSGVRNSLGAQEFGADYTELYRVRGGGLAMDMPVRGGVRPTIEVTRERHDPARVHAEPATNRYRPAAPALALTGTRVALRLRRATALGPLGVEWRGELEARTLFAAPDGGGEGRSARVAALAEIERPFGSRRLVGRTTAALALGNLRLPATVIPAPGGVSRPGPAPQDWAYAGGPISGPGYADHAFVGSMVLTQRLEWHAPVPFIPVRLGRFGRAPGRAMLAPWAHLVVVDPLPGQPGPRGAYPSLGIAALVLFDAVRIDVGRGVRRGGWMLGVDVIREFWGVL